VEAGKVELDGATYAGFSLPFSISQLVIIEVLLVGGAELYRNSELDPEKRCYPGGLFDPLNLASESEERTFRLKTAEIKHGRLAMIAFLGKQCIDCGDEAWSARNDCSDLGLLAWCWIALEKRVVCFLPACEKDEHT
jgi:Chlorophyll A-B binding protein